MLVIINIFGITQMCWCFNINLFIFSIYHAYL